MSNKAGVRCAVIVMVCCYEMGNVMMQYVPGEPLVAKAVFLDEYATVCVYFW